MLYMKYFPVIQPVMMKTKKSGSLKNFLQGLS